MQMCVPAPFRRSCSQRKIPYTLTMSVKEQVLQAIQRLPDDIDFRDVADEIALLAAVQEAERDIKQGRLISNEEMKSRIGQWSAR
jgi:predicted transcriptional regulator